MGMALKVILRLMKLKVSAANPLHADMANNPAMVLDAPIGVTPSKLFINVSAVKAETMPAVTSIKYRLKGKNLDAKSAVIMEITSPTPKIIE